MNQPLDTIIPEGLHLEMIRDTIFDTLAVPELVRVDPFNTMRYKVEYKWEPGVKYRFSADSASIVGIYNEWNKPFKHEFTARAWRTTRCSHSMSRVCVTRLLSRCSAPTTIPLQ